LATILLFFDSFYDTLGYIKRKYCEVVMDRIGGLEPMISYRNS